MNSIIDLWNDIRQSNVHATVASKGEKEDRGWEKKIEIITDNFPKFVKDYKSADSRISTNCKQDKRLCAQSWPTLRLPWAVGLLGNFSMGFSQARILEKLPFPPPGDFLTQWLNPQSPAPPLWQADSSSLQSPGKPLRKRHQSNMLKTR